MYEHTHTHTVRRKHMEMKSSGRRRGSQRPGNTHTLIQKHTRTLLICMLRRCPLTSTCACLCSAACSRYLSSSRCRPPRKQPKNTQFLAEETCRASKQDRQKAACHTTPAPCACFCVQRNYKTCVFVHHWCQKPKHPGFIRVWSEKTSQVVTSAASLYLSALCVCVWSHQIISLIFYRSGFIVIHLPDNMLIHPAQPFGLYFTETTPALQPEENTKKKKIKCHTFCKHWSSPGPASSEFALNVFLSDKRFDCGGRRCKTSTRNTFKNANAENMRWFASLHYSKGLN